jgi:hypothetical protein
VRIVGLAQPAAMDDLTTALDRLRRFRDTFNAGEPVNEESGLFEGDRHSLLALHPSKERNRNNNASDSPMARCLLCTSNDDDAQIEHLVEKLWDAG